MAPVASQAKHANWISWIGIVLTSVSAVLFLTFFFLDLFGFHSNPYLGILTFVLLPAGFILGLCFIPAGLWRTRRRLARGESAAYWPTIDLSAPRVRHTAIVVLILTAVNIAIVALAATQSVEYVDSRPFCTTVCHTPMEPEAVAHERGVHASLSCTACHVGPGAEGFVRAKLGGVRRLATIARDTYARPILSPVRDLPDAVGTCRNCHTATKYVGEKARQFPYYSDDEESSEQVTTMVLRVGGGGFDAGGPGGIHWHASPDTRIEYIATGERRETIPWVRVSDRKGAREYAMDGVTPEQLAAGERRAMDCTDCHNRIGHGFAATAERAVDSALARGLIPRTLPFARRETLAALSGDHADRTTAEREIATRLAASYGQIPAGDARLRQLVRAAQDLYGITVFPAMKVTWGTYPSNIGHTDAPGCFRCHDDGHKTAAGMTISQDCELCHRMP